MAGIPRLRRKMHDVRRAQWICCVDLNVKIRNRIIEIISVFRATRSYEHFEPVVAGHEESTVDIVGVIRCPVGERLEKRVKFQPPFLKPILRMLGLLTRFGSLLLSHEKPVFLLCFDKNLVDRSEADPDRRLRLVRLCVSIHRRAPLRCVFAFRPRP